MAEGSSFRALLQRFPALARLGIGRRRVPYIQQHAVSECGAACLAMALGYHGQHVRLDDVREVTDSGHGGTDLLALLHAARWFGLRGRGLKIERIEDLELIPRGSILHWRFNHFVVLDGVGADGDVLLVDPARGYRRVSSGEARRSFTGMALALEPAADFQPGDARPGRRWDYLRRMLLGSGLLPRILITSVLVQLFALAVPLLIGALVDHVVPRREIDLLPMLALGFAAFVAFHFLALLIRSHLLLHLRTRLDAQMTRDFLDHLMSLPYGFFQKRTSGDLMMRLNSNAKIREILTSGALSALLDGLLVSLYLVLIFFTHSGLGFLVLGLALMRLALFFLTRRKQRELMSRSLDHQARFEDFQVQMFAGIETLKASGAEQRSVERWSDLFVDVLNVSIARGRLDAAVSSSLGSLALASPLVVLLFGGYLVLQGDLSLGTMLAINGLAGGLLGPLSSLVSNAFRFQLLGSYLDRTEDVLNSSPEQMRGSVALSPRVNGRITVEKLQFRYGSAPPLVLRDISLDLQPGSFVAIAGRSGAGKSTLASLLVGLYRPTQGRILFDGADLDGLHLPSLRRQIGIVSQHPYLFATSIRENIALTDPRLPLSRVVEAAEMAAIHDEILAMPMGYETVLPAGGTTLSGGQRQRLAIARALVHRPVVLLLDESTSSLDAATEARIHGVLRELAATRIVIAHRLSTMSVADRILVIDDGRIVEQGSHGELVARGGAYCDLISEQILRSGPTRGT